ncbi:MAG: RNA polymerase sigma-70 factor [Saprospiraceae bacterium]
MEVLSTSEYSSLIKTNPEKALEYLYSQFYNMLCNQVFRILKDNVAAEDIVQDVFFGIWRKRDQLVINTSLEAYLKRSCRNRTLNYIRNNHMKWEDEGLLNDQADNGFTSDQYIDAEDLNQKIQEVIAELPEKCGIVFSLSRFEEMSYADIAVELNISVKTVEHHISKALRILREKIFKKE